MLDKNEMKELKEILSKKFNFNIENFVEKNMEIVKGMIIQYLHENRELIENKTFSTLSFDLLRTCIDCGKPTDVIAFYLSTDKGELNVDCAGRCRECFREASPEYNNISKYYKNLDYVTLQSIYTEEEIEKLEEEL